MNQFNEHYYVESQDLNTVEEDENFKNEFITEHQFKIKSEIEDVEDAFSVKLMRERVLQIIQNHSQNGISLLDQFTLTHREFKELN